MPSSPPPRQNGADLDCDLPVSVTRVVPLHKKLVQGPSVAVFPSVHLSPVQFDTPPRLT